MIYNGNWTEWSAIWAEIICMISKSNERAVQVQFEITSMTWTKIAQHKVQLPLYYIHFEITQRQDLVSSNILLMQYWTGLKLNSSIFGGKNWSFGNKSCKICHMILFVFHFPAIWLVILNKPRNLMGCFVFSVACSLAWKKKRFKAKNGAIHEQIAPSRANQITGTTSDFKMDVVKT